MTHNSQRGNKTPNPLAEPLFHKTSDHVEHKNKESQQEKGKTSNGLKQVKSSME